MLDRGARRYNMEFSELLNYCVQKYGTFSKPGYIAVWQRLIYIQWSYNNYHNKPEFARLLYNDVLALLSI